MNTDRSHHRRTDPGPHTLSARAYCHSDIRHAPMITLQDTPLVLGSNNAALLHMDSYNRGNQSQRTLNPNNPRHQRVMRRHEDDVLPSYLLNGQALENIVIRNAPVPDQIVFGSTDQPPPAMDHGGGSYMHKGYSNSDLEALGEELEAGLGPSSSYNGQSTSSSHQHRSSAQRADRHRPPRRRESQQNLL